MTKGWAPEFIYRPDLHQLELWPKPSDFPEIHAHVYMEHGHTFYQFWPHPGDVCFPGLKIQSDDRPSTLRAKP